MFNRFGRMSKGFKKFLAVVYFILSILCVLCILKMIFNMIVSGQPFGEIMSISVVKDIIMLILGSALSFWGAIACRNGSKK